MGVPRFGGGVSPNIQPSRISTEIKSTLIVNSVTPGAGIRLLGPDNLSHCENACFATGWEERAQTKKQTNIVCA